MALTVAKAHAYGNDFLFVPEAETPGDPAALALAREYPDRLRLVSLAARAKVR